MKTIGIFTASALLLASATVSYAQGTPGTAPEDKGKTGWTGGAQDQPSQDKGDQSKGATTGQKAEVHDEAKAKDQPPVASGEDLKGPAVQNAPSKTPE